MKTQKNNPNFISSETAFLHASAATARNISAGITHLQSWRKAKLKKTALEIYDINGTILFYDFDVLQGKDVIGTIRTAANKVVSNPVISFRFGAKKWNHAVAFKKITTIIKKQYPKYKITDALLVCYSYPKIGWLVNIQVSEKEIKRLIYDVADYSLIPEKQNTDNIEGSYAWSFLDSISSKEKTSRLKRFTKFEKGVKTSGKEGDLLASVSKLSFEKILLDYKFKFKIKIEKQLQFCTHYSHTEPASHHCFVLHAQQVNDYCAVATCQMILCFHRYYFSQDEIAPACGYSTGGCPADSSAGYETMSNNHILATFDSSPTWEKARDQINLIHPLKSGISGHARACAGYSNVWEIFSAIQDKKLYIYDPWPWNSDLKAGGDIYWEDWDSITHTNFIYTELDY